MGVYVQLMRELSPTHRMKGKDGDAAKKSLRTDSVRITKWEWVEEALDSKYSIFTRPWDYAFTVG